jgi:hypothetical protein
LEFPLATNTCHHGQQEQEKELLQRMEILDFVKFERKITKIS